MNQYKVAAALRLLADAVEALPEHPADAAGPTASSAATASAPAAAPSAPKPRGRPPKGVEGAAPQPAAAPAAASSAPTPTPSVAPAPASAGPALTHAQVVPDFKAAAVAHGTAFVKGLLTQYAKGPTFDTVPVALLGTLRDALKAGPKASDPVADLLG